MDMTENRRLLQRFANERLASQRFTVVYPSKAEDRYTRALAHEQKGAGCGKTCRISNWSSPDTIWDPPQNLKKW